LENDESDDEQDQESQELIPTEQALIPTEQDTILFNGKPLVVVRLPDGRPGVVLRWICENLHIGQKAQVERIKRTEVIADDLVYVQVQTGGGFQTMATLVLDSVAYWLATIETRRMKRDDPNRLEILAYQRRAVAALFSWASSQKAIAAPSNLVPSEPIVEPMRPAPDASLDDWIEYHRRMTALLEWRRDVDHWRGGVDKRLEGLETVTSTILKRLGPQPLTLAHQSLVQYYVNQLHEATDKTHASIQSNLRLAFGVPSYKDIPEAEWGKVVNWFRFQMDRAHKKLQEQAPQQTLFDEPGES
jgi:P22_AR N-terminal domain